MAESRNPSREDIDNFFHGTVDGFKEQLFEPRNGIERPQLVLETIDKAFSHKTKSRSWASTCFESSWKVLEQY